MVQPKDLTNGDFWVYRIADGGCGIVKAEKGIHPSATVADAYKGYRGEDYSPADIECRQITEKDSRFRMMGNVIELGWNIELN